MLLIQILGLPHSRFFLGQLLYLFVVTAWPQVLGASPVPPAWPL